MTHGPDITRIAALIGEPARAAILGALMDGRALTARELASAAGVTPQTASGHLAQLLDGGLIAVLPQGRHRYYRLAGPRIAGAIEALMGLSTAVPLAAPRTGPRDPALRAARVCYDHLAGAAGTRMHESLGAQGLIAAAPGGYALTGAGEAFCAALGLDPAPILPRKPHCRDCLDWSERRPHLAGPLGRALLAHAESASWLRRSAGTRALAFTPKGRAAFDRAFPLT